MMEDRQKRPPEFEVTGEDYSDGKKQRQTATTSYGNDYSDHSDDIVACLSVDEATMAEIMDLLDKEDETSSQSATRVKFITDPYSLQQVFRSYTTYVTINGNEETCGSSFSDSDSSVMASVDVGNVFGYRRTVGGSMMNNIFAGGACSNNSSSTCGGEDEEVARYFATDGEDESVRETNGSDCFDWEDVLLAKFLGEDKI